MFRSFSFCKFFLEFKIIGYFRFFGWRLIKFVKEDVIVLNYSYEDRFGINDFIFCWGNKFKGRN